MNKELCFCIEHDNLYLEQVLVDYNEIPIYFLCKGQDKYYLTLCTDIENYNYVIVEVSLFDVCDILHGNVSMRDAITKHKEYWNVISGDDVDSDVVERKLMKDIDKNVLPTNGACYQVLTERVEKYVESMDEKLLHWNFVSISKLPSECKEEISSILERVKFIFKNQDNKLIDDYVAWNNGLIEKREISPSCQGYIVNTDNLLAA